MKRLSDYVGDEAIELWADLLDPLSVILSDDNVKKSVATKTRIEIAKDLLKTHSDEVTQILLRIDPSPIDGLTVVLRLVNLLAEIGSNPEISSFFGFAGQAAMNTESFGSATESTGAKEK